MERPAKSFSQPLPIFPQIDGIFLLDKPAGRSSARCLGIFKKMGQKKVGHAGTLDPLASGLLLVLLGQATKLAGYLQAEGRKTYRGILKLGEETDTWDADGEILARKPYADISPDRIHAELVDWKNQTEQQVPPFSAAKLHGKPFYEFARKGVVTPVRTKKINIFEADILDIGMPFVSFRISCSSGSYVRSLAHSLGKRLGCGATLYELVREYSHPYSVADAVSMRMLEEHPRLLRDNVMPLASALPQWEKIEIASTQVRAVKNGQSIPADCHYVHSRNALLCSNGEALALARLTDNADLPCWSIIRGLWN